MKEKHSFNRRIQKPREECHWRCGDIYRALSRIYPLDQEVRLNIIRLGLFVSFGAFSGKAGHCLAGSDNVWLEVSILDVWKRLDLVIFTSSTRPS
jgi:hypothetical protein